MAASTDRQWRRREGERTHSVSRDQASSRETRVAMPGTLAERPRRFERPAARPSPPMQKFVIDGGVPLSGTLTPAGNKNGALPILAASVLTDEEVVIANVPRISDVETMLEILEGIGVSVEWRDEHE